ncbi:MAG TPA: YqeG family HAD IIIA-type phosphatase [Clostridiales bacterium]|nr:YqeG family HAD IIIA-type phosphatase [Clostridiales bacterium]
MKRILVPNEYTKNICQIDLKGLLEKGIMNIIIDLDNTLLPWDKDTIPDDIYNWVIRGKDLGCKFCILSNNSKKRIEKFADKLDIIYVLKAPKPWKSSFKKAVAVLGGKRDNTVVIGDQIFTDILGGNRLGLYTILVSPLSQREFFITRIVRLIEGYFLKQIDMSKG